LGGQTTDTVRVAGSGLVFNNTFEASVTTAFEDNIITAEQNLASLWTNSVTLNLEFTAVDEKYRGLGV
jgi:nitrogen fixation protein FixH